MTIDFTAASLQLCPSATTANKASQCDQERKAMFAEIRTLTATVETLRVYVSKEHEEMIARTAWNEAVESCATLVLNGRFLHDEAPTAMFAREVAPAIRKLKRGEHE